MFIDDELYVGDVHVLCGGILTASGRPCQHRQQQQQQLGGNCRKQSSKKNSEAKRRRKWKEARQRASLLWSPTATSVLDFEGASHHGKNHFNSSSFLGLIFNSSADRLQLAMIIFVFRRRFVRLWRRACMRAFVRSKASNRRIVVVSGERNERRIHFPLSGM